MGDSPTPPAVADPNSVAANQQTLNTTAGETSQQGSMVNQSTPYGSLTYNQTGTSANGTPLYTATTSLTPAQQQLLNTLQGTQQTAGNQASTLLNQANYGSQSPTDAIGSLTSGMVQQGVQQEMNYLNPIFQPQVSQLDTQLRNQGFDPSSPAYKQAMNNLLQSQGQQENSFVASIQPQAYQQATQEYQMPAQMAESLGQFGASTNPTFQTTPSLSVQPANLVGATANAQTAEQQTYQDQLNQQNAMMSGLFGIPTAILGGWAKSGGLSSLGAAALA